MYLSRRYYRTKSERTRSEHIFGPLLLRYRLGRTSSSCSSFGSTIFGGSSCSARKCRRGLSYVHCGYGDMSFWWFELTGTVRRSFHCLRLANWLIYPSNESVLTLMLIGNVMQNEHEPDAAWALLGTTIRLAQSIGLHLRPSEGSNRSSAQLMKEKIW